MDFSNFFWKILHTCHHNISTDEFETIKVALPLLLKTVINTSGVSEESLGELGFANNCNSLGKEGDGISQEIYSVQNG